LHQKLFVADPVAFECSGSDILVHYQQLFSSEAAFLDAEVPYLN
jgi:hypothetical protein